MSPVAKGPAIRRHINIITLLAFAALLALGAVWVDQLLFELTPFAAYDDTTKFGDDCEYATGLWREDDDFERVRNRPHAFVPLAMPYRGAAKRPAVVENGYLVTRCRVDLSGLSREGYAWLSPGVVFGASAIWLNGTLKTLTDDKRFVEIALTPEDRRAASELLIISRAGTGTGGAGHVAGLASLTPLAFGSSQASAARVFGISARFWQELPMTRANLCIGLLIIYAAVWLAGLRYADVGWMAAMLALLAIISVSHYYAELPEMKWMTSLRAIAYIPLLFAFLSFVFAFIRVPFSQPLAEVALVAATAVYGGLHFWFNDTKLFELNSSLRLFWGGSALGLVWAAILGWRRARGLPARRRLRIRGLSAFNLAVATLFIYLILTIDSRGLMISDVTNIAIAVGFAAFLAVDLVVFQRQFFEERALRLQSDEQTRRMRDNLVLGRVVQRLLLPDELEEDFGPYHLRGRHQSSDGLAGEGLGGNWHFCWHANDRLIVMLGEVTGQGPSAALAVSAIMSQLQDARWRQTTAVQSILHLERILHDMFQGHLWTTLVVLEAEAAGRVRYASFGAGGWLRLGRGEPELLRTPGPRLGLGDIEQVTSIAWPEVQLAPGEAIVAVTDGFIEGTHRLEQWRRHVSQADLKVYDFAAVLEVAEGFRQRLSGTDQDARDNRTILGLEFRGEDVALRRMP